MIHKYFEAFRRIILLLVLLLVVVVLFIFMDSERDNMNSLKNQTKVLQISDMATDEGSRIIKINPPPHTFEVRLISPWEGIIAANFNQNGGFVIIRTSKQGQNLVIGLTKGDGTYSRHSLRVKGKEKAEKAANQYSLDLRGRRF